VGNSGILGNASHGQAIDAHQAVWRLNLAFTYGHEKDVGQRTTLQLMHGGLFGACDATNRTNSTPGDKGRKPRGVSPKQSAHIVPMRCDPGDARYLCRMCLPNGDDAAVVIRPTPGVKLERIKVAQQRHRSTPFVRLRLDHHLLCHEVVREYAALRLEASGAATTGPEAWKAIDARATTGLVAVVMALVLCEQVSGGIPFNQKSETITHMRSGLTRRPTRTFELLAPTEPASVGLTER